MLDELAAELELTGTIVAPDGIPDLRDVVAAAAELPPDDADADALLDDTAEVDKRPVPPLVVDADAVATPAPVLVPVLHVP